MDGLPGGCSYNVLSVLDARPARLRRPTTRGGDANNSEAECNALQRYLDFYEEHGCWPRQHVENVSERKIAVGYNNHANLKTRRCAAAEQILVRIGEKKRECNDSVTTVPPLRGDVVVACPEYVNLTKFECYGRFYIGGFRCTWCGMRVCDSWNRRFGCMHTVDWDGVQWHLRRCHLRKFGKPAPGLPLSGFVGQCVDPYMSIRHAHNLLYKLELLPAVYMREWSPTVGVRTGERERARERERER